MTTIPSTENAALSAALAAAINNKTKPLGSLGMLEVQARQPKRGNRGKEYPACNARYRE